MEDSMNPFLAMVAGIVLLLTITPSWGQPVCAAPGCNPTGTDANGNTAGGTNALLNVDESPTGGFYNTAFGFAALLSTTTGLDNTASGIDALLSNTTGSFNTANGSEALRSNTTGNSNTASGFQALFSNNTGSFNTASGQGALSNNTTGSANTATGAFALEDNTTGTNNTATGLDALLSNTAGSNNTAVGARALRYSTGTKNIGIGYQAGILLTKGKNNIYLGNLGAGDESLTMRLGSVQTSTYIAGINTATVSDATVMIDTTTGQLGIMTSSARYKRDIETMARRSEGLLQLRPVTFAYKDDAHGTTHYGLIAEEVATVYPELVTRTASGDVQTVKYHELIPMLLNELQHEHQALQREHQALEQQRAEVGMLRQELAELRALVGSGRETASRSQ
jgi:hypothetical protein